MLLLNIQSWSGDIAQGMALARLFADLEDKPRTDVCVMFTSRFDCPFDEETISYVGAKFKTYKFKTKRKATGWPNGPNQMMGESYEHAIWLKKRGVIPELKSVMFVEADCVPLHKDWLNMLIKEYNECGKEILGAWLKKGDAGCEHVNGNCIVSIDFYKRCPAMIHPPTRGGWDAMLAYAILPNAAPSKLIWSDYRLGTSDNEWKGCDYLWNPKRYGTPSNALYGQELYPCYIHGTKTMHGLECARKRLIK